LRIIIPQYIYHFILDNEIIFFELYYINPIQPRTLGYNIPVQEIAHSDLGLCVCVCVCMRYIEEGVRIT